MTPCPIRKEKCGRVFLLVFGLVLCLYSNGVSQSDFTSGPYYIDSIIFKGNEQTKEYLLLKEMSVHPGDTLSDQALTEQLSHNEDRLLNTGLFNEVNVYVHSVDPASRRTTLQVEMTEAWYIYPIPIFELADRNFNVWWDEHDRQFDRINLGMKLYYSNVSGQNDRIKAVAQLGFTKKFEIQYERPFFSSGTDWGFDINALYTTGKEIAGRTSENKPVFLRDEHETLLHRIQGGFTVHHRSNPYLSMKAGLKFYHWDADPQLLEFNPYYLKGKDELQFIRLTHEWSWDHRDRKIYPREGTLLRGTVEKWGVGLWDQLNRWSFSAAAQIFHEFNSNWSVGVGLKGKHFPGDRPLPYRLNQGLGYGEDYVRGYERVVIDGTTFAFSRSEVKFKLAQCRLNLGSWVPLNNMEVVPLTFYLSGGVEGGWAKDSSEPDPSNNLVGDLLLGTGLGLDILIYENYLFSIDFSTTRHGYGGVFLHSGVIFD